MQSSIAQSAGTSSVDGGRGDRHDIPIRISSIIVSISSSFTSPSFSSSAGGTGEHGGEIGVQSIWKKFKMSSIESKSSGDSFPMGRVTASSIIRLALAFRGGFSLTVSFSVVMGGISHTVERGSEKVDAGSEFPLKMSSIDAISSRDTSNLLVSFFGILPSASRFRGGFFPFFSPRVTGEGKIVELAVCSMGWTVVMVSVKMLVVFFTVRRALGAFFSIEGNGLGSGTDSTGGAKSIKSSIDCVPKCPVSIFFIRLARGLRTGAFCSIVMTGREAGWHTTATSGGDGDDSKWLEIPLSLALSYEGVR